MYSGQYAVASGNPCSYSGSKDTVFEWVAVISEVWSWSLSSETDCRDWSATLFLSASPGKFQDSGIYLKLVHNHFKIVRFIV